MTNRARYVGEVCTFGTPLLFLSINQGKQSLKGTVQILDLKENNHIGLLSCKCVLHHYEHAIKKLDS